MSGFTFPEIFSLPHYSEIMKKHTFALLVLTACTTDPYLPDDLCAAGFVDYQAEVQPILTSNCAMSGCHDAQTAEEDVRMDNYNEVVKQVDGFHPGGSELWEVINESGEDRMPPPPAAALTAAQKEIIKRWILEGAQNTSCTDRCDTLDLLTYSTGIGNMINTYCKGCHGPVLAEAGLRLDSYVYVTDAVTNSNLLYRVGPDAGSQRMPPGSSLSDCQVRNIQKWVDQGMPE